jgi:hypothetical protein
MELECSRAERSSKDRLDGLVAVEKVCGSASRRGSIEAGEDAERHVLPGDRVSTPDSGVDPDSPGRRLVREESRAQDRMRDPTRTKSVIGELLRDEVMSHRGRTFQRIVDAHRAHHHEMLDAPGLTRFDHPDRSIEIHEQRLVGPGLSTRSGAEDDAIASLEPVFEVSLEIAEGCLDPNRFEIGLLFGVP